MVKGKVNAIFFPLLSVRLHTTGTGEQDEAI
jgi:hypothetical protein